MNESVRAQTIGILYGKSEMELRLPRNAHATVIGKRPMAKLPDPRGSGARRAGAADRYRSV